MDQTSGKFPDNPIVVTGLGKALSDELWNHLIDSSNEITSAMMAFDCRPIDFLRQRKTLKFMSKQDRLALEAAGRCIGDASLSQDILSSATGVFMTVGYIPFEFDIADKLAEDSIMDNQFSMHRFATNGIGGLNPLLAFTCLPNMPAHHIAMNNELFGPYCITYPDNTQFYLTLEEAVHRLLEGSVRCALVGGVADQDNFLVNHHFNKKEPCTRTFTADCSAFIILETQASAASRNATIHFYLESMEMVWHEQPHSPAITIESNLQLGPGELPLRLAVFEDKNSTGNYQNICENSTFDAISVWKMP